MKNTSNNKKQENQNIEWKESWHDDYIKWICGFANAQGGTLVIGKNDGGEIVGVVNAKKLLEDIPNKVRDILGIIVDVNQKTEFSKEYIEIVVEPHLYPVSYKGKYHYRSGSTKQELKGSALDAFLLKKHGLHWDGVPLPGLIIDSLEDKTFTIFAKKAVQSKRLGDEVLQENKETLISKLQLTEGTYLKRAAALLFYNDPEKYITGTYIKIGFFMTSTDLIYQDEIHGNLFKQVEKTMDLLLTKYMKAYISYDKLQRLENYFFPVPALREALLNAIVHKDYASNNPVQIRVYEDKIVFWNAGRLPDELTIELLQKDHPSIPYNPLIASVFFRAGYIEAWGRGIQKINDECRQFGISPPDIKYEFSGLTMTFYANLEMIKKEKNWEKNKEKTGRKTREKTGIKTREKTRVKILKLISDCNDISISEISSNVNITQKTVEWHIKCLKEDGIIERFGHDRGGYWKIIDKKTREKLGRKPREKTREKTREKKDNKKTIERILNLISEDPSISVKKMSDKIGYTQSAIEWHIKRLKEKELIERIGPPKGGYWRFIKKDVQKDNNS